MYVCMCPTNSLGNNWQVDMVMCIISEEGASERMHRISTDTGFQDLCIAYQLSNSSSVIFMCLNLVVWCVCVGENEHLIFLDTLFAII